MTKDFKCFIKLNKKKYSSNLASPIYQIRWETTEKRKFIICTKKSIKYLSFCLQFSFIFHPISEKYVDSRFFNSIELFEEISFPKFTRLSVFSSFVENVLLVSDVECRRVPEFCHILCIFLCSAVFIKREACYFFFTNLQSFKTEILRKFAA